MSKQEDFHRPDKHMKKRVQDIEKLIPKLEHRRKPKWKENSIKIEFIKHEIEFITPRAVQ